LADVLAVQKYPIPSPTVIFIKPPHLVSMMDKILKAARKNFFLFPFAWRHKVAGVAEGFLTKDSLWDRLVFDAARASVIGDGAGTLRAVIVSGGTSVIQKAEFRYSYISIQGQSNQLS
jgi:long-chain acyl-CoA synthetase